MRWRIENQRHRTNLLGLHWSAGAEPAPAWVCGRAVRARLLLQLLDAMVEEMVRWEFHMRDLGARGAAVKAARGRRTPHELRTGSIDEGLASEGWGKWVRIEVVP
jgi:hypothetical protein